MDINGRNYGQMYALVCNYSIPDIVRVKYALLRKLCPESFGDFATGPRPAPRRGRRSPGLRPGGHPFRWSGAGSPRLQALEGGGAASRFGSAGLDARGRSEQRGHVMERPNRQ